MDRSRHWRSLAFRARCAPALLEVIAAKVQANIWRSAAAPYLGRGLEFGVDITGLVHRIREWRAAGRLEEAALLVTIVSGGIWHGHRRVACGFIAEDDQTAHCVRCNRGLPDTALHRYWGCTANEAADAPDAIKDSQYLRHQALAEPEAEAYWCRGLLPSDSFSFLPRPPAEPVCWQHGVGPVPLAAGAPSFESHPGGGQVY